MAYVAKTGRLLVVHEAPVGGGCLYVRHGDWLYTYDVRGEQTVAQ